jgi:hypothetical protein
MSVKSKSIYYYYYYYYYHHHHHHHLLQLSFHPVAVAPTLVQTKQIRITIHKRNNTKHSKYKCTYYQNTHTILKTPTHYKTHKYTHTHTNTLQNPQTHTHTHPHITKPTNTHTNTNTHTHYKTSYNNHSPVLHPLMALDRGDSKYICVCEITVNGMNRMATQQCTSSQNGIYYRL